MILLKKYCILGNDERSLSIKRLYKEELKEIVDYDKADVIIGQIPFREDNIEVNGKIIYIDDLIYYMKKNKSRFYSGAISDNLTNRLNNENILYFDVLKQDGISIKNAIPTAEGTILTIISNTDFTIHCSNILILGYGNIGKVLSKMLHGMGANVFCEARNKKDIALIEAMGYNSIELSELNKHIGNMDVIINTIPAMIMDESRLNLVKKSCLIVDLSSQPGGVNFEYANKQKIKVIWALSLPSKIAPKSAAIYIKEVIDKIENER